MADDGTWLSGGFAAASYQDWRKLVDAALNGLSFDENLVSRSYDGIALEPVYGRAKEAPALASAKRELSPRRRVGAAGRRRAEAAMAAQAGRSGVAGQQPLAHAGRWDIIQRIEHPDLDEANALIHADLDGGATGIELVYPSCPGARGYGLSTEKLSDFDRLLDGVPLDKIAVRIDGGHENRHVAVLLAALVERRGEDPAATRWRFACDPITFLAVHGRLSNSLDQVLRWVGDTARGLERAGFTAAVLSPDGRAWHAAGASEAQELALMIASAVAFLKGLEDSGLSLDEAVPLIGFSLAADADQLLTIAKIRALRRLWARVQEAAGLEPSPAHIHAETAWRTMTARAPYVNMVRATMAAFAAGVGGADSIAVLPFTAAIGLPDAFARRIARNTQSILIEETNAHRVADPTAGSGAFEGLTDALARKAWDLFAEIERNGGIMAGLRAGRVQDMIRTVRQARAEDIATRRELITGVSDFADPDEKPVAVLQALSEDVVASNVHLLLPEAGTGGLFEALLDAARAGGSLADMVLARESAMQRLDQRLPQIRLAEPFEALRAASDAHLRKTGARPTVFLARLGPEAESRERAAFAETVFALGSVVAVSDHEPAAAPSPLEAAANERLAAAFQASGAGIACLCGSDEAYRAMGGGAADALRQAGAKALYLVGEPGADDAKTGIGSFIHVGCNVLEILREALAHAAGAEDG